MGMIPEDESVRSSISSLTSISWTCSIASTESSLSDNTTSPEPSTTTTTTRRSTRESTKKSTEQSLERAKAREERRLRRPTPKTPQEETNQPKSPLAQTKLQTKMGTADTAKATLNDNLSYLMDEVQCLVGETSEKFVPQPSRDDIISDLVKGLRRFRDTVRWKDFHRQQQIQKLKRMGIETNHVEIEDSSNQDNEYNEGLQTGLTPTKVNLSAPRATEEVEAFLHELEQTLLDQAFEYNDKRVSCPKSSQIKHLQQQLRKNTSTVVIPTDKTNSFRVVPITDYTKWVLGHLQQYAREVPRSKLTEISEKAKDMLDEKIELLSKKEVAFLRQSIDSKAIPSPKLLIKDHKKENEFGHFPTRLVVPASNFTSAFPKLGYLGIKKIFDDNKVDYMAKTIIQAADLKKTLEKLTITNLNSTIVSIDAVDYYPSVRFKLVKKAIHFFSDKLSEEDKTKIEECLDMIKFGMGSTLITFIDKYYEYDGDKDLEEKGLTIGGYESAWLADLAGAYILANTQQHFQQTKYHGIYRDDGIAVFTGQWSYDMIVKWRDNFQKSVNKLAEGDYLQFTCSMWLDQTRRTCPTTEYNNKVSVERSNAFPYLDMELVWSKQAELNFQVHLKPNQQLKYLNKGSAHTKACFRAIPAGVCHRLAKLTTITDDNCDKPLDEIYPHHFSALKKADLLSTKTPTLKEETLKREMKEKNLMDELESGLESISVSTRQARLRERNRRRSTFFCIGYSRAWKTPIHTTIKELAKKFKLNWLRVSMSYHRFTNLREIFQGDLTYKLTSGVTSKDFDTLECNCRMEQCGYNNHCRKPIVVYKIECLNTNKSYIGNTQQHFKNRMQQHFSDVKKLHQLGIKSDSYARHFAEQLSHFPTITPTLQRNSIKCSILWQGNPISVVKTFGTPDCALCNRERLEILKLSRKDPKSLINSRNEIYGACKHNPKFHRYNSRIPSTDESNKDERVTPTNFTTEESMMCGRCLIEV